MVKKKAATTKKVAKKSTTKKAVTKKKAATKKVTVKKKAASKKKVSKKKAVKASAISPQQRYHMVSEAAYHLSEQQGFDSTRDMDNWLLAEQQIESYLKKENIKIK